MATRDATSAPQTPKQTPHWINTATNQPVTFSENMDGFSYYSGQAHFYTEGVGWRFAWITAHRPQR